MSANHNIEIKCPKCGEVREQQSMLPKTCRQCRDKIYRNKRLDTMRRPSRKPYCGICVEKARFEYHLTPPPSLQKRQRGGPVWTTLCDLCFNTWLESGRHRVVPLRPEVYIGSKGRPYTQDERDAISAGKRVVVDNSTGLLTNEWRR